MRLSRCPRLKLTKLITEHLLLLWFQRFDGTGTSLVCMFIWGSTTKIACQIISDLRSLFFSKKRVFSQKPPKTPSHGRVGPKYNTSNLTIDFVTFNETVTQLYLTEDEGRDRRDRE